MNVLVQTCSCLRIGEMLTPFIRLCLSISSPRVSPIMDWYLRLTMTSICVRTNESGGINEIS
jgi:hypothetical protein